MLAEEVNKEQALAIKALVLENEKLTLIKDNILNKIEVLHQYNVTMNNKQALTVIMEEEFRKVMKGAIILPEVAG